MTDFPHQEIFERDNWTCQYCGLSGTGSFEQWNRAWFAIDHITPKNMAGLMMPPIWWSPATYVIA